MYESNSTTIVGCESEAETSRSDLAIEISFCHLYLSSPSTSRKVLIGFGGIAYKICSTPMKNLTHNFIFIVKPLEPYLTTFQIDCVYHFFTNSIKLFRFLLFFTTVFRIAGFRVLKNKNHIKYHPSLYYRIRDLPHSFWGFCYY